MAFREPKKEKGAKLKAPPEQSKPSGGEHLTISLRHLVGSHCISKCQKPDILSFADKVRMLTQKTWSELQQAPKHGLGFETIARTSLKVAVPKHVTPEVNILAFRFSGKMPMVGYKDGQTFHVLWFDREFAVYPH
jgi:hypothetical protein